ncbi:MAG TPA: TetR family transcriptional regulator [Gemmatimonadaceae bacterium]
MIKDGDTEQKILQAARAVFVRRGTSGARMQEIAEEAGVNQALLHYYFRSKEKLSEAVFSETAGRMFPAIIGILGNDASIEEKVDQIVATYIENMSRSPFLPGYILSELHHHPERIPKLIGGLAGKSFSAALAPVLDKLDKQIASEARKRKLRRISAQQFLTNLLSLCVFPFAARPMLSAAFGFDEAEFARFIAARRKELPQFIMNALRP